MSSRKEQQSEATRRALVRVGRDLFARRGFNDVSTEEIVRRAGVTRGALYHHFRDKRDLFRAVVEDVEQAVLARVAAAALTESDPWEQQTAAGGARQSRSPAARAAEDRRLVEPLMKCSVCLTRRKSSRTRTQGARIAKRYGGDRGRRTTKICRRVRHGGRFVRGS